MKMRMLLGAVVLVATVVTVASLSQTPTYEASALALVDEGSPAQGTGNGKIQLIPLAPAPETLRALTQTMIHAIDSRPVAEKAIQRLELEMSAAELLDNLTIEQDAAPNFIRLTYEGTDSYKVKKIVDTVSEVSSERISPISAAGSKFRATMWDKAAAPESPVSSHPLRNGLLTVVGWALIGLLVLIHRSS